MGKQYIPEGRAVQAPAAKRSKRFRRVTALALALVTVGAVSAGSFATVLAEDAVITSSIVDGNKHYSVSIPSTDVDLLLQEAGITLGDEDVVVREENANGTTVTVKRKLIAEIDADGEIIVAQGYSGDTVGQLIENAGVTLDDQDAVSPSISTPVWDDTDVRISEKRSIYIVDNNVARNYIVPAGTVAQALEAAGITLGKEDTVSNQEAAVEDGMVIQIDRVTYETVEKTEEVDFAVEERQTADLEVGETVVETEGQKGEKLVTYEQKLVNGKVVEATKLDETVTVEAQNQVVLVGTTETMSSSSQENTGVQTNTTGGSLSASGNTFVDAAGNVVEYKSMVTGSCTAYTGDKATATGMMPAVGVVAVNPNVIPYGSRLYITSPDGSVVYGYAIAGDTGGAMMAGHAICDLYMNTKQECYSFGRRTMNIYILS